LNEAEGLAGNAPRRFAKPPSSAGGQYGRAAFPFEDAGFKEACSSGRLDWLPKQAHPQSRQDGGERIKWPMISMKETITRQKSRRAQGSASRLRQHCPCVRMAPGPVEVVIAEKHRQTARSEGRIGGIIAGRRACAREERKGLKDVPETKIEGAGEKAR